MAGVKMMLHELHFLTCPWEHLTENTATAFQQELNKELSPSHRLFGTKSIALARRIDNDDVLFWIEDLDTYAIVHLTWTHANAEGYPITQMLPVDELAAYCKRISEEYKT
ncbi:hypothetical protein [Paenibacillus massiliensis]|uniref:hypothetical protein n=1 Tax=Paenibacillus massiliensis TaxID=225917 RepID=UPI0003A325C4|nr:hypothetical protein [Paenibacillus massiliensis]